MFFAATVQTVYVIGPWKGYFSAPLIVYLVLVLVSAVSHSKCQFSDPGTVPRRVDANTDEASLVTSTGERPRSCRHCVRLKPLDAHHCSSCERCIVRMDHHCPWVNNCVAFLNQKYFVLFCFYTSLCCLFSIASLVTRFLLCQSKHTHGAHKSGGLGTQDLDAQDWCHGSGMDVMCCIINMFEGVSAIARCGECVCTCWLWLCVARHSVRAVHDDHVVRPDLVHHIECDIH